VVQWLLWVGMWVWIREKCLWSRPDSSLETGFEFSLLLAWKWGHSAVIELALA
jgi:hypothetical protein